MNAFGGLRFRRPSSDALLIPLAAVLLALPLGCVSHEEDAPVQKTASVSDIDARIRQVQANQGMPESARQQVLKSLQQQRDAAAKAKR